MKYELIPEGNLFRIRALKDFGDVKAGDLGGFVESEKNLSHVGDCWISDDAKVFDSTRVSDDARISVHAMIF